MKVNPASAEEQERAFVAQWHKGMAQMSEALSEANQAVIDANRVER